MSARGLDGAKRLIVKIGSALLVDDETGRLRARWLHALADDVAALKSDGKAVAIVSSGAIAVGRNQLGLGRRKLKLEEKQAAAAAGQIRLAHAYQEALARHGITVAQVRDLFDTSRKYALALLEYLDAKGVTRRAGDERVLR